MEIKTKKFAVWIDEDHSSIHAISSILEEVVKYGIASVKRVYRDCSKQISAVKPDFDSRNYGRAKLSGLIETLNLFETKVEMSQMYLKKMKK